MDHLLGKLSKAVVEYFIGNSFVGALAYADDIVLLAPLTTALYVKCLKYVISMHLIIVLFVMLRSRPIM